MLTQGGFEQQMPPHAMVAAFGVPNASYVPITHAGAGYANGFAPMDIFMDINSCGYI
jgi:hypothetical protein